MPYRPAKIQVTEPGALPSGTAHDIEAGAGFAVVAEEVRSLAQRSAISAKGTAKRIEDALAKSSESARISAEVSHTLAGIIDQVRPLDSLINGIAQALTGLFNYAPAASHARGPQLRQGEFDVT